MHLSGGPWREDNASRYAVCGLLKNVNTYMHAYIHTYIHTYGG